VRALALRRKSEGRDKGGKDGGDKRGDGLGGRPHDAIIAVSEEIEADLVVVRPHGDDERGARPHRQRVRQVLYYCKRPVLLVRDA
jgi:hypothetical protein